MCGERVWAWLDRKIRSNSYTYTISLVLGASDGAKRVACFFVFAWLLLVPWPVFPAVVPVSREVYWLVLHDQDERERAREGLDEHESKSKTQGTYGVHSEVLHQALAHKF